MTRAEAVSILATRLGKRTDMDDDIATELQLAQTELEQAADLPWFLLSEVAYATTSAGEERLALPSDFLREYEEGTLFLYDADAEDSWVEIHKESHQDLIAANTQELVDASGEPAYYALTGDYFRLWPIPDDTYTVKMMYYKKATVLSSASSTNDWLTYAPEVLMSEAGIKLAGLYLQNPALASVFQATFDRAWSRLLVTNEARKHTNANYWMTYGG